MAENAIMKNKDIQSRIYIIRNLQVMLDKDLAVFYGVKPIRLREQVKRNIKRFPLDFMFQLTEEEAELDGIAKCDTIKTIPGRLHALCLYRTGCGGYFPQCLPARERLQAISRSCVPL